MTSVFNEFGDNVACTVIEMGPCVVTQVKGQDSDGYNAVQLAFSDKKEKNTSAPLKGHFKKANTTAKAKVAEFRSAFENANMGDELRVEDVFVEGDLVKVTGKTKGKGFQGVVKRHRFGGVGQSTHGQHNRLRAPGSIGACSYPAKVFKGMKMAGRMGGDRVTTSGLKVMKVFPDKNLLLIKGAIPGHKGAFVIVKK